MIQGLCYSDLVTSYDLHIKQLLINSYKTYYREEYNNNTCMALVDMAQINV